MKKINCFYRFATVALLLFSSFILVGCGYRITYDAGEAGSFDKEPESPTLEGHGFGGWYYDEEFKNPYDPEEKLTEDITLYAKWIPEKRRVEFKVAKDVIVKEGDELTVLVDYGDRVKVPYLSKENDKLAVVGWYTDDELLTPWDPEAPVTEDVTVYPEWGNYYDSVYFNAPKIYITTEKKQKITSKETYVNCEVTITNTDESPLENASAKIRGRGNTTWTTISDKKPYRVKFDKKTDLFGMGKEKDYLLIANYIDFTLMRNDIVYKTAAAIGLPYTTETEWVHLFLNGKYEGVYLLCEQTETGTHRIDIGKDDAPGNEEKSGEEIGFLVEVDGAGDHGDDRYFQFAGIRTKLGMRQWRSHYTVNIKSPGGEYITDEQYKYIKEYMNEVNRAIAIRDMKKLAELVDMDSLVDYFIVVEMSFAVDMGWTFYMYKPAGEKLHFGPVWDYDQAFGSSNFGGEAYDSWVSGEENLWFTWLLESNTFKNAVQKRWEEVYGTVTDTDKIINRLYSKYKYDAKANFVRWDEAIGRPYWRSPERIVALKTYEANVIYLRSWLKNRIEWMDTTIRGW